MNMMKFSYLFECHFSDGTVLQQNEADVSNVDPAKSSFFDVIQRKDEVVVFGVFNDQHSYAVDLRDGSFLINGAKFFIPKDVATPVLTTATDCEPTASIQSIPFESAEDQKYELIFFRRHKHVTIMGASDVPEDLTHQIEYHLGWTTKVDDKEIQQTISVS
jgi:hypothetical protein